MARRLAWSIFFLASCSGVKSPGEAGAATGPEPVGRDSGTESTLDSGERGLADAGSTSVRDGGSSDAFTFDIGRDAGSTAPADPSLSGPYTPGRVSEVVVASSGNELPLDCWYPTTGPSPGPFPAVIIGHGFQIAPDQYSGYADRLASFGYVACTADFQAGFLPNHAENAADLRAGVDWLVQAQTDPAHALSGLVDGSRLGIMGHSLGGKLAFLVASDDSRIGAVLGLDPVDGSTLCSPSRCPDATDRLPLAVPIAVLGETTDAVGRPQACAPAADNFQTFYDASGSPALEVDVLGANHMSFLDDPEACGLPCRLCLPATAAHSDVLALAYAYTVAFFERYLRGVVAYDTFLDGTEAVQRYVQPGRARLRRK